MADETPPWLAESNVKAVKDAAKPAASKSNSFNASSFTSEKGLNAMAGAIGSALMGGAAANQFAKLDADSSHGGDVEAPKLDIDPAESEKIEKWATKLRSIYIGTSVLMSLSAFFSLGSNDLSVVFMALYVWFFAILILCFELALRVFARMLSENFGFMYHPIIRPLFLFMNIIMCYELGLLGKICVLLLLFSGCMHVYVMIKHPMFEEVLRRKHFYNVDQSMV
ncbi:unnamed protein product [Symbiodinium microadriaticum]|nr:unnamed protein product [Symbiodinium microadriaticum]